MAVVSGDIKYHLSIPGAALGMASAQPDANASLGGFVSTTEAISSTLHALFDPITGDENAAEDVEYRCVFVRNSNGTSTLYDAVAWLSAETAFGADAAIGLDPAGIVAGNSSTAQAAVIADEDDAPTGVTFSAPTTKLTGLNIGDIGPGQVQAIWLRRTATDSDALNLDGFVLRIEGDTGE